VAAGLDFVEVHHQGAVPVGLHRLRERGQVQGGRRPSGVGPAAVDEALEVRAGGEQGLQQLRRAALEVEPEPRHHLLPEHLSKRAHA
jgi:hypothetical protein